MVKFGLDSFSYHLHLEDPDTPRDAFWFAGKVFEMGLDGCHFDPRHLSGWDEDLVRGIGRFCAEHGLYLELGSGGFGYERLSKRLELASEVGARAMRTFIGGERFETPAERREELIGWTIGNFKLLAEVAERVGVPLTLENHEDLTSLEVIRILDAVDSPFIRACVDTGNSLPVGEDPVDCVRNLAPYAAVTHLKDWKFWWENGAPMRKGCALGEGDAVPSEVYPILRKAHPDMPITLEIPTINPDWSRRSLQEEEDNVVKSIKYVKDLESIYSTSAWHPECTRAPKL